MDPELYEAAASGDLVFLKGNGANLDVFQVTKFQQNSFLHIAVRFNQVNFCREILMIPSSSSLLLMPNSKGETPLHIAARLGSLEITKLLVDRAKDQQFGNVESRGVELLRVMNVENDTALHLAARNGRFGVAKYLIQVDVNLLSLVNSANATPLNLAVEGGFFKTATYILKKCPNSLIEDIDTKTMLHSAVFYRNYDVVKLLLERIPNSRNGTDQIGWTALHYAAYFGNLISTQLLLQGNNSIAYIVDQDGISALHVAASRGHIDVVELLVQSCPDIYEVTDKKGRTLLHVAVISGEEKMVKHILQMPRLIGILNEKDNEGNTALHVAVIYKKYNIAAHLARNWEIKRTMKNNNLFTAYDIFLVQPKKLSLLVAKIHYLLRGTNRLPGLRNLVQTKLKRKMIGKTEENDTNTSGKEDEGKITIANEASDETKQKSRLEIHLLIAMLIATVTFQAAFTVPGGYKEDGPDQGTAQFIHEAAFRAFVIFNTIAFIFSIATVLIQHVTSQLSYQSRFRYAKLAQVMIGLAIFGMLLAFASGMYVVLANSIVLRLMAYTLVGCFSLIYSLCYMVDPLGNEFPILEQPRLYLRDLLFHYGIV